LFWGTATGNLPTYSDLALEAWDKTADKGLIYSPSNDTLIPNWEGAEIREKTGLDASVEETKMYIKALAELPRLILHDCGIACSKEVIQVLDEEYSDLSKLMEFHFLRHGDAILAMKSQNFASLSSRADTSNSLEELGKDIWKRKEHFCQWTKAFSVSELWFCCEIETCFEGLREMGLLPGGKGETKAVAADKERDMIKILEKPETLRLIYPENAQVISLSPYHALLFTADKIAQQNVFYVKKKRNPTPYQQFIRNFRKHTNYVRKTKELARVKLSPDGQRLIF
jgi:hypothetical protein